MILEIALGILLGFILILLFPLLIAIIPVLLAIAVLVALGLLAIFSIASFFKLSDKDLIIASSLISALACLGFLFSDRGTLFLQRYIKPEQVEAAAKCVRKGIAGTLILGLAIPLIALMVALIISKFNN